MCFIFVICFLFFFFFLLLLLFFFAFSARQTNKQANKKKSMRQHLLCAKNEFFSVRISPGHRKLSPLRAKTFGSGGETSFVCEGENRRGVQVPFRSRTLCTPRLQLQTYHDNTSVREALEQLKRTCFPFNLNEEEELLRMDPAHNHISSAGKPQLNVFSGHLILYCFTFCDLRSLCEITRVSRRFAALSNAHHLWETHARLMRVGTRAPESAREDLRRAVLERREAWRAEEQRHELEYEELERRLGERVAAERAVPLPVGIAFSSSGLVSSSNNNNNRGDNGGDTRITANEQEVLRARLEELEAVKLDLVCDVNALKSTLSLQRKQIEELQRWMRNNGAATAGGVGEEEEAKNEKANIVKGEKTFTFSELLHFERRICQILLSTATDLSLVLRRGVEDFGTMELLSLSGGGDGGSVMRQRWAAFKRFFPPFSEDYGIVRALLASGESPQVERQRECIARIGAVIRRVQRMKDDEIVQIVM